MSYQDYQNIMKGEKNMSYQVVLFDIYKKEYDPKREFEKLEEAKKYAKSLIKSRIWAGEKVYIYDRDGDIVAAWKKTASRIRKIY